MNSNELYNKIDSSFQKAIFNELWTTTDLRNIYVNNNLINSNFFNNGYGLFLDNTSIINRVFIMVFPDEELINNICQYNEKVLILTRHPFCWNLSDEKYFIYPIKTNLFDTMKSKNVSMYVLHNTLEESNEFSATNCFVHGLKFKHLNDLIINNKKIAITEVEYNSIHDLSRFLEKRLNHPIKVYNYGSNNINNYKVAITSGIMFDEDLLEYLKENDINTLISGVTTKLKSFFNSITFHLKAEKYRINIIGTTHYSSEKWSTMNLLDYFRKVGLSCIYLPGKYDLNDL